MDVIFTALSSVRNSGGRISTLPRALSSKREVMKPKQAITRNIYRIFFLALCFVTFPLITGAQGRIAFSSTRQGGLAQIFLMNATGSDQHLLRFNDGNNVNPSFSRDGSKIVFESSQDGNREIYVMNADGTNQIRLTNNPARDEQPVFNH